MSDTPKGLLPTAFERRFVNLMRFASNSLARLGISPDLITAASFGLGLIAGILLAFDRLHLALLFGFLMGLCDIIDGQIAVIIKKTSRFGGILDSVVDRYTDFMLFCGLGMRYYLLDEPWWALITFLALIGSFGVSYVKARGEGEGLKCNVGLIQRSERLVLIGIGVLFGGLVLKAIIIFLAVFSNFTAAERLFFLKKISMSDSPNSAKAEETDQKVEQ